MSLDNDAIVRYLEALENESKALKTEALRLCWYMRGGVTFHEVYDLTYEGRLICKKLIEENIETTKKTGLPFF